MTLRLTDEESEALRIQEYLERDAHRSRVVTASSLAAKRYRDVLRRLGEA